MSQKLYKALKHIEEEKDADDTASQLPS